MGQDGTARIETVNLWYLLINYSIRQEIQSKIPSKTFGRMLTKSHSNPRHHPFLAIPATTPGAPLLPQMGLLRVVGITEAGEAIGRYDQFFLTK